MNRFVSLWLYAALVFIFNIKLFFGETVNSFLFSSVLGGLPRLEQVLMMSLYFDSRRGVVGGLRECEC